METSYYFMMIRRKGHSEGIYKTVELYDNDFNKPRDDQHAVDIAMYKLRVKNHAIGNPLEQFDLIGILKKETRTTKLEIYE